MKVDNTPLQLSHSISWNFLGKRCQVIGMTPTLRLSNCLNRAGDKSAGNLLSALVVVFDRTDEHTKIIVGTTWAAVDGLSPGFLSILGVYNFDPL